MNWECPRCTKQCACGRCDSPNIRHKKRITHQDDPARWFLAKTDWGQATLRPFANNEHWGRGVDDGYDGVIHAIGFAPADELNGDFTDVTTREGSQIAHDISSYSLVALAKASRSMLAKRQGSILTLTYLGSQVAMPNYNVMGMAKASLEAGVRYLATSLGSEGIRVNAISAGAIRTLASSGIKSMRDMLTLNEQITPLKRNVTQMEVANTAVFLLSDWASGITGEVVMVDAGFHAVGMSTELLTLSKDSSK